MKLESITSLLKYKKQIILQGSPGTGKTLTAKKVAGELLRPDVITGADIGKLVKVGTTISSATNYTNYTITGITDKVVNVKLSNSPNTYPAAKAKIIAAYAAKLWLGGQAGGNDPYEAAVAKFIYENIFPEEQLKIIQFHPSYSYEDFVRGIVAKPNPDGEGIIYEAENKVLAQFANEALNNFKNARLSIAPDIPVEEQTKSNLDRFITHIIEAIDKDGKYPISDNIYIFYVDNKRFKYKGDNWEAHPNGLNMNFSELEKIIAANILERADIVKLSSLNALTRSHATYYANVLEKYYNFLSTNVVLAATVPIPLKNYVLIIDEINRANLSSVLGELIYALEYRGKEVDFMYAVNESSKLVLPPNLYIIGTMNTADRSVGHIDYAIRRRFAFLDIPPTPLQEDAEIYFNTEGYANVARLFEQNVSNEFEAKDVQIGHSYFIAQKEEATDDAKKMEIFRFKMDYEVIPILNEYVKDGILMGTIDGQDVKEYIKGLKSVK